MRVALLFSLILLAACTRALSPGETSFAKQLFSQEIDTAHIRFNDGAVIGKVTYKREKRPRLACRERIWPEPTTDTVTVGPAAVAIHNKVFFAKPYFSNDYLSAYPERINVFAAMLFAHELTHVWQWQNRAKTGYSPVRAANEHNWVEDPYLYDITTKTTFLDFAFEQQASIVEEYVCCAALDPSAPRTKRLESLLRGAFPLGKLTIPRDIYVPWDGVQKRGICH
jgi:hypothetical protein